MQGLILRGFHCRHPGHPLGGAQELGLAELLRHAAQLVQIQHLQVLEAQLTSTPAAPGGVRDFLIRALLARKLLR